MAGKHLRTEIEYCQRCGFNSSRTMRRHRSEVEQLGRMEKVEGHTIRQIVNSQGSGRHRKKQS